MELSTRRKWKTVLEFGLYKVIPFDLNTVDKSQEFSISGCMGLGICAYYKQFANFTYSSGIARLSWFVSRVKDDHDEAHFYITSFTSNWIA